MHNNHQEVRDRNIYKPGKMRLRLIGGQLSMFHVKHFGKT